MRKTGLLMAALLVFAVGAKAQGQIATATSSEAFELRGASVSTTNGVPSWPVMPGDVVVSGDAPVTLTFADGSKVVMSVLSKGIVTVENGVPTFDLQSGLADYSLKGPGAVQLKVYDKTLATKHDQGSLSTSESGSGSPISPLHSGLPWKGILIGAGTAGASAGIGYGVYTAVSGGSSVSPSR
jgi:hypothetical protein